MIRFAGFLLALTLFTALGYVVRGYVIDDTFIHLQYARNLLAGHGMVFNAGEPTAGTTSPLWALLLALGGLGGADLLALAKALGIGAGVAALALLIAAGERLRLSDAGLVALALVWAANAWMARWTVSGMETPAAVALVLGGWLVAHGGGESPASAARRFAAGAIWALAALARPEAGLLVALYALASLLWPRGFARSAGGGERLAAAGAVAGGAALVLAPFALYALDLWGTVVPGTLAAKSAGGLRLEVAFLRLRQAALITGAVCAVEALAVLVLLPRFRALLARGEAAHHLAAWAWIVLVPLAYAARGVPVISRYLLPLLALLTLYAWWAIADFHRDRRGAARLVLPAAAVLALALNLGVFATRVVPHTRDFVAGLESTLVPWGIWLGDHTAADAEVATPDIGAVAYYSQRRVFDLGGLVSPEMVPHLEAHGPDEAIRRFVWRAERRPEYLIDRGDEIQGLARTSPFGAALEPLSSAVAPSLGVSKPDPVAYTLYRIDWEVVDSLEAVGAAP